MVFKNQKSTRKDCQLWQVAQNVYTREALERLTPPLPRERIALDLRPRAI